MHTAKQTEFPLFFYDLL